ncbi:MAG TPA: TetR/AcrR family transcriptional regulator [Candidatus Deferrimicrobiaceae bacterium]
MGDKKGPASPAVDDVRSRLLAGATGLFARKGYAATTVREIVEAAGVTKPVLYYYFANKEALYLELMRAPHARFLAMLDESVEGGGSASDKIRTVLSRHYEMFVLHNEIARIGYAVYFGPPQGAPFFDFDDFQLKLMETIRLLVREGIGSGEFRDGDIEAMTLAINAVQNFVNQVELCRIEMRVGLDGLARMLDVLLDGMRANDYGKGKRKRT